MLHFYSLAGVHQHAENHIAGLHVGLGGQLRDKSVVSENKDNI